MPFDDDGEDDAPVFRAPLPPEDRIWRHPSELGRADAPAARPAPSRTWAVAVVAGVTGAALTLGIVAATGGLRERVIQAAATTTLAPRAGVLIAPTTRPTTTTIALSTKVAEKTGPSIARIEVGPENERTAGSAVALGDDGYLVTSARLVEGSDSVDVVLADGSRAVGAVVGADPITDVAVLEVGVAVPGVTGSHATVPVGLSGYAVGAPAADGERPSVTGLSVTAIGDAAMVDGEAMHGLLQLDATVPWEMAGGPVVDARGALVGLVVMTDDGTGVTTHALPAAVVARVVADIIVLGWARHPWLGVEGEDLADEEAAELGLTGAARITGVTEGSPAEAAGIEAGDLVTAIAGSDVESMSTLIAAMRDHAPGERVEIRYRRDDVEHTTTATLGEKPH